MAKQLNRIEVPNYDDILVFGYSCKHFRDDAKALYIDSESHLIPWMGNPSLMIDRYDVRGALYDLDAAAATGNHDPTLPSAVEQKEEELCEYERYLALYHDLDAATEREEEETKRLQIELESSSSDFNQVGFTYDANLASFNSCSSEGSAISASGVQCHPEKQISAPQGYYPTSDDDTFIPPPTLIIPPGFAVPLSIKQHKIIVKTAKFIAKQGSQMEIVLKTKQANNVMFGFLSFDNKLNQYYKHIVGLIKTGKYVEEESADTLKSEDTKAQQTSFNPSADAAPGIKTPKAQSTTKSAPPPDCSYSKLISKIRENQAKSGLNLVAAELGPQSSSVSVPDTPAASSVTAGIKSVATAVTTTSTLPSTTTSTPVSSVTVTTKAFTGLVDYPSFNRTNEDDKDGYSHSDSDSDVQNIQNGLKHNEKTPTKAVSKRSQIKAVSKKKVHSNLKDESKISSVAIAKSDSYDDIRWPSPNEQMAIDKIACYTVKNGIKFEEAVKSRGDIRFCFLNEGHKHHPYYQLKLALYTEVFGAVLAHIAAKQSASDVKTVVESSSMSHKSVKKHNKNWSSGHHSQEPINTDADGGNRNTNAAHTISFSIKQRREQEVTLPATSFPLESSSSEEELEDVDEDERERKLQEREDRRSWRKMKREQFEREKREKREREEKTRKMEEEKRLKEESERQRLKELEEQENASGDEEMYDIFKYAQESANDKDGSPSPSSVPAVSNSAIVDSTKPLPDQRMRRKKAAHAFLSKLKGASEEEPMPTMIGPQLPPEMVAQMMDISPIGSPTASPTPSSPSHTPPPLEPTASPPFSPQPPPASDTLTETKETADTDALHSLSSSVPLPPPITHKQLRCSSLLAAAVSTLLSNECAVVEKSQTVASEQHEVTKSRRHKSKHRRDASSVSSDRSPLLRSLNSTVKKRKRKHSHSRHHKKRRHHSRSPHRQRKSSSGKRKSSSSHVSKKKKSKSSSSKKEKPKKKKSRRHRSASISSVTSASSYSSSSSRSRSASQSRSRSSSSDTYRSFESRSNRSISNDKSPSDHEVQVISDSNSSSGSEGGVSEIRGSSVLSVSKKAVATATPVSSRPSSASRDAALSDARLASSGAASPAPLVSNFSPSTVATLTPPKPPLPAHYDIKSSTAVAKITQGLRAKVHALMDKKRPDE